MAPQSASVVTRFAPSPTGFLHIGGARTALFNYLFARHHGGQFRLRIEDTDRQRSTPEAIEAILNGLTWLNLEWDGDVVYQFARANRHAEVAQELVAQGKAYLCYATPEELEDMRVAQKAAGLPQRYDGRWRNRDPREAPAGVRPVVRIKAEQEGATTIHDLVQGDVTVQHSQLDDMVLLRSDGTPTYMLAVVVDDYDMGVTHVIRGDDHLNNAFRQLQLIRAMGWPEPIYANIPLIHGADGAKLSKRHGALGVAEYQHMGILPEAMENALLRLGWSHGNEEVIRRQDAIQWFGFEAVGRSAARFDMKKLEHLNGIYMRASDDVRLLDLIMPELVAETGAGLSPVAQHRILAAVTILKARAKTLIELAASTKFLVQERPLSLTPQAHSLLTDSAMALLQNLYDRLVMLSDWTHSALADCLQSVATDAGIGLGKIGPPLRAALTGSSTTLGLIDLLVIYGRAESQARLEDVLDSVTLTTNP